jgi:hypothetical protein
MKTTILIEKTTRDILRQLGSKGQSYDNLINWLIRVKTRQMLDRKSLLEDGFENRESSGLI